MRWLYVYAWYPGMRIGEIMSEISKKNEKELRKAWKEHLKRQARKNAEQGKQTQMHKGN